MREVNPTVQITTNFYENTPSETHNWVVCPEVKERITIRFNNKEYGFVLDSDVPLVEIWAIDPETDEISHIEKRFDLTEPGNTSLDHGLEGPFPTEPMKWGNDGESNPDIKGVDPDWLQDLENHGENWTPPWSPEDTD